MTAREIFDDMSDEELSTIYSIVCHYVENYSHCPDCSDDELANVAEKL